MQSRLLRAAVLALLVAGGLYFYRTTLRPDPKALELWAEQALYSIFGPDTTHGRVTIDLLGGVRVEELNVQAPTDPAPALWADEVEIRHDPLALLAGVLRLETIVVRGPVVRAHGTAEGTIALDFPFDPPRPEGPSARAPRLVVEAGAFRLKAAENSTVFALGTTLVLGGLHFDARPDEQGGLRIEGAVRPEGVGLREGEEIVFSGEANLEARTLDVYAVWDRMRLTRALLDLLSPALLERIQAERLEEGPHRLAVRLERAPDVEGGRLRVRPEFKGTVRMDVRGLPGAETIDARTREQINDLFGRIALTVNVEGDRIDVRELTTQLAGGDLRATGRIDNGGESVDLDLSVQGLRLDDPALRRLLGEDVFREVRATGAADATITLRRDAGGPFRWEAAIDLIDATLIYFGREVPEKLDKSGRPIRTGFPYAAEHCYGRVYVSPEGIRFDPIEGRHGAATIRIRGRNETSRAGGETGYVRFVEGDTDLCVTIEARHVPFDRDLEAAVNGSEFSGLLETYRPTGVVDRVVLDVLKRPLLDKEAAVEVDIDLADDRFVFAGFPLPLAIERARVGVLRPVREDGTRGKEFHIRAKGTAADGAIEITADLLEADGRGRIRVNGRGVRLRGPLEAALRASEPGRGELGRVWTFLAPDGRADVAVDLPAFDDPAPARHEISLRGASVTLGEASAPERSLTIEHLEGRVVAEEGRVTITGVAGRVGESSLTVEGALDGGTEGRWDIRVATQGLPVTPGLLHVITTISPCGPVLPEGILLLPGGGMDLGLHLLRVPLEEAGDCQLTASVEVRRADLRVRIGELEMAVRGGFSVDGDEVAIEDLVAEGRGLEIRIPKARVGEAGLEGELGMRLTDVVVGPEVLGLLPEDLRATFADLTRDRLLQATDLVALIEAGGAMTLRGALVLSAPPGAAVGGAPRGVVEFAPILVAPPGEGGERTISGLLRLRDLDLDVGTRIDEVTGSLEIPGFVAGGELAGRATLRLQKARVAGLRLRDVHVPLQLAEGVLWAAPIRADVYGGRLDATLSLHVRSPIAFEGRAAVPGLSLRDLLADLSPGSEVRGRVALDVAFQSRGPASRELTAAGTVSVVEGDLGELPVVATLPALFGALVKSAKKPKFHSASARFVLHEEVLHVPEVVLAGPIFSMRGFGSLALDGRLDFTFAPQFLKTLFLPGSLQIPGVREVLGLFAEDSLYVARVRGTLEEAKTALEPLPFLVPRRRDPLVARTPPPTRNPAPAPDAR